MTRSTPSTPARPSGSRHRPRPSRSRRGPLERIHLPHGFRDADRRPVAVAARGRAARLRGARSRRLSGVRPDETDVKSQALLHAGQRRDSTSFLGAQTLRAGGPNAATWIALMCFFGVDLAALAMLWPRGWEFTASLHTPATILPLQRWLRAPLRSAQCSRTEPALRRTGRWQWPQAKRSGSRRVDRAPRLSLPRTQARRRKDGARPNDHAGPPRQGAARRGCTPMLPCDGVRHCLGCERPRSARISATRRCVATSARARDRLPLAEPARRRQPCCPVLPIR